MASQAMSPGNRALLIDSLESHAQSLSSILGFIEWGPLEWVPTIEDAIPLLQEASFSLLFIGENEAMERGRHRAFVAADQIPTRRVTQGP